MRVFLCIVVLLCVAGCTRVIRIDDEKGIRDVTIKTNWTGQVRTVTVRTLEDDE